MVKMIQLAPIPQVKGPEWGRKSVPSAKAE
jgi:hypothetical protein